MPMYTKVRFEQSWTEWPKKNSGFFGYFKILGFFRAFFGFFGAFSGFFVFFLNFRPFSGFFRLF